MILLHRQSVLNVAQNNVVLLWRWQLLASTDSLNANWTRISVFSGILILISLILGGEMFPPPHPLFRCTLRCTVTQPQCETTSCQQLTKTSWWFTLTHSQNVCANCKAVLKPTEISCCLPIYGTVQSDKWYPPLTRLLGYANPENRNALVETKHRRRWWKLIQCT
jgi:hypothetical protein